MRNRVIKTNGAVFNNVQQAAIEFFFDDFALKSIGNGVPVTLEYIQAKPRAKLHVKLTETASKKVIFHLRIARNGHPFLPQAVK